MAKFELSVQAPILPAAVEDFYDVLPNTTKTFTVIDNDFLGVEPTVVSIEINPTNGTVTLTGSNVAYTPTTNFVGTDSFYYRITDSNGDFDIAKININIG